MRPHPGFPMAQRLIFLSGPPSAQTLQWREDDLLNTVLPAFQDHPSLVRTSSQDPSSVLPAWRSVTAKGQHLPTGLSQLEAVDTELLDPGLEASFLGTPGTSSFESNGNSDQDMQNSTGESNEDNSSQFYDHSFAVHENVASSQVLGVDYRHDESHSGVRSRWHRVNPDDEDTDFSSYDMTSDESFFSTTHSQIEPSRELPTCGRVTNLRDIPNGRYLEFIEPQTVSVNIIGGIIQVLPPRSIQTRRTGQTMEIVEMLIGDDTKSGFCITFWLFPENAGGPGPKAQGQLRDTLLNLRPQDIILARNVALSSFRGRVTGQSLRKNLTQLHLLFRDPVDKEDRRGLLRQRDLDGAFAEGARLTKARLVRDWVLQFVGPRARSAMKGNASNYDTGDEELPPDTQ